MRLIVFIFKFKMNSILQVVIGVGLEVLGLEAADTADVVVGLHPARRRPGGGDHVDRRFRHLQDRLEHWYLKLKPGALAIRYIAVRSKIHKMYEFTWFPRILLHFLWFSFHFHSIHRIAMGHMAKATETSTYRYLTFYCTTIIWV